MKKYIYSRILPRIITLTLSGVFLLSLSACGVKGDLYLPSEYASDHTAPSSHALAHRAI